MKNSPLDSLTKKIVPKFATETCPFLENGGRTNRHIRRIAKTTNEDLKNISELLADLLDSVNKFNNTTGMLKEFKVYLLDEILRHRLVRRVIINGIIFFPPRETLSANELPIDSSVISFRPDPFYCQLNLVRLITENGKRDWKHFGTLNIASIKTLVAKKLNNSPFIHDIELIML